MSQQQFETEVQNEERWIDECNRLIDEGIADQLNKGDKNGNV